MPQKIILRVWYWAPAVIWMAFIFYGSSQSCVPQASIPNIDKFFHTIEYFVLGYLTARAFCRSSDNQDYRNIFMAALIIASLYGASDEFHQRFVAGRSCDIFDFIFDVFGASLGAWLCVYKERVKNAVDKTV